MSLPASQPAPAFKPVHGTVVHVEFTVPDLAKASAFYGAAFGWQILPFQPKELYFMTPGNAGPCGCLLEGTPGKQTTVLYIQVDGIPEAVRRIADLGGTLVKPKTEIPGGHGFYAHVRAPDGNLFGLYCRS